MAIKFFNSIEVDGEVQGTSLDINGNADISGNLGGLNQLTSESVIIDGGSGAVPLYARSTGSVSYIQIQNSATGNNTTSDGLTVGNNGATAYVWQRENANLVLGTNDTTALTLDTSQNATFAGNVTLTGIVLDGNTITGVNDSGEFDDDDAHIMTSAGVLDKIQSEISNLVDSAPGTLNTLNELAAALGDDAAFSTTVTNSIATKLPLAGGTMSGAIAMGNQNISGVGNLSVNAGNLSITGDGSHAVTLTQSGNGDFTIDAPDDIRLDAGGGDVVLKDDGTEYGRFGNHSGDLGIRNITQDKDIIFKGNDGGTTIDALTLDMSAGGAATFIGAGTFETTLNVSATDAGGSPAMTAIMNMHGYDQRGVGIKMKDNKTTSGGGTDAEWFVGTGYSQTGFNIGYASDGSQSSYAAQNKFSISTAGNATIAGTIGSGAITSTGKIQGTELEGTSLDINGNADISGNLTGVDALTMSGNLTTGNGNIECNDLDVSGTITGDGSSIDSINAGNIGSGTLAVARGGTGLTSISTLLNSNVTSVSGSSGSCTGNAATATTATTATNANNVKTTSVSNSAEYFGVFVDSNGTAYQDLHVGAGLKYNPNTNVLSSGKVVTDTVRIVENAKSTGADGTAGAGEACMTITGAGAGNEANIALKIQGTAHGDPVKLKIKGEDTEGNEVGKGLLSFDPDSDSFSIGQSSSHNSMAIKIDNSDVAIFKNMSQFVAGIDITGTTDATNATGDTGMLRCEGGASIAKKLYVGSTITGSADVIAFSDRKLKDNIETLDGKKVLDMRGVSFTRKDTGAESSGVIAQEIQKVAPELVHDTEGTLGVAYGNLVGYLIEAIKDQQKQIDELKELCNGCSK